VFFVSPTASAEFCLQPLSSLTRSLNRVRSKRGRERVHQVARMISILLVMAALSPSCAKTRPIGLRGLAVVELEQAAEPGNQ
jgi:hypothetical protein